MIAVLRSSARRRCGAERELMSTSARIQAPKTTRHLEQLRALVRGEGQAPPIAELVGFDFVAVEARP
jgi:hypothetical protein